MNSAQYNLDALKAELEEYGFVVLPNVIPTEQANHMADHLMEIMSRQPDANRLYQLQRGIFNHDDQDVLVPVAMQPVVLELAKHLLGEGMQMAEVCAFWNKPGAPAGGLHADVPVGWFVG